MHFKAIALVVALASCSTVKPSSTTDNLALSVGSYVELRGEIGVGKIADYVLVKGIPVYFVGDGKSYTGSIPIGTIVIAKGVLQQYVPATNIVSSDDIASVPMHYFISSAQVVVVP